jgi:hypothetical protein
VPRQQIGWHVGDRRPQLGPLRPQLLLADADGPDLDARRLDELVPAVAAGPEHVVPLLEQRPRQRDNGQDVADPTGRGDEYAHGPSAAATHRAAASANHHTTARVTA